MTYRELLQSIACNRFAHRLDAQAALVDALDRGDITGSQAATLNAAILNPKLLEG